MQFVQPVTILSALPPSAAGAMAGLFVSTVVSLFIVPVFYTLIDDMQLGSKRWFDKLTSLGATKPAASAES